MLVFGRGCYSKPEFLERHEHLDEDHVDLVGNSCNEKLLRELQLVVDNTSKNRKRLDFIPSIRDGEKGSDVVALAKEVIDLASSGNSARVVITDGVHQQETVDKDGKIIRHFTASVPGHESKWHFYLRTKGSQLYGLSSSANEAVRVKRF